jgi:hypothetical protein
LAGRDERYQYPFWRMRFDYNDVVDYGIKRIVIERTDVARKKGR